MMEWGLEVPRSILLRQLPFSLNHQVSLCMRRSGSRLPAAHSDEVIARRNETVACFIHVTQIARLERQLHVLLLSGLYIDASESTQRFQRSARELRERNVKFHDFVPVALAGVLHVDLNVFGIARIQRGIRQLHPAVFECGVTQSVPEAI